MTVTAIVLAAGRGVRLGGPKALLAWPAESGRLIPLAAAHAARRLAAESDRVLVVTRADIAAALRRHAPGLRAELVISSAPDEAGPAGSIQAAVHHLGAVPGTPGGAAADPLVLLTPVDCPPAKPATVQALLDAIGVRPELVAARPQHGPRRGHPVLLRLTALAPYGAGDPPPLRDRLRELGDQVADVAVADPAVLLDVNRPADLAAWAESQGLEMAGTPHFFGS